MVTASPIGATIEWYDFFLYGVVAGIMFNKLYFPSGDPQVIGAGPVAAHDRPSRCSLVA